VFPTREHRGVPVDTDRSRQRPAWVAGAVIATAAALLLGSAAPGAADPRDDKKRVDAKVARAGALLENATARARAAAGRLVAATAALPGAHNRVAEAQGRVAAAIVVAHTARRAAAAAQDAVDAATVRYAAAARNVDDARDRVSDFVAATYKGAGVASFNAILEARTPQDLADRAGYVERAMSAKRHAVDALVEARWQARNTQNEAILADRRAEQARRDALAALGRARAAHTAARQAADDLAALVVARREALVVARQERAASLAGYRRARAEAAAVEAQLRAWEARQRGRAPTWRPGRLFLTPVHGFKTSDFGMRYDPFFHVWQLHAGVDLAAPGGAPIFAAADGRVIRAGWNGGYGNYTCLSHGRYRGRWISTCYAHQSRILVGPGRYVHRGQIIGRVGTTGASTGYHLHFEVRLNGRPVQPLGYLPACLC
jgi:murein DD-endopeptidase MepM/ murein hydrolase activator NlpD